MKINVRQYAQTLMELTDGKSEQEVLTVVAKFAETLQAEGQLKNANKIMEKFSESYNKAHGIVVTEVVVRQDVSQDVLDNVKKFVREKYDAREVEMNVVVDEKIQGGIIVKVGDEIMDGSIKGQLVKLKKVLSS